MPIINKKIFLPIIAILTLSLFAKNPVCQASDPPVWAYVVNAFSSDVSVIDTDTQAVITTVPIVEFIFDVAITPDGRFAYVSGGLGADSLFIIRTSDNTLIGEIPGVLTPFGLDITPDGAYIYVASRDVDEVTIVRVSDNTVIGTVSVGDQPLTVAVTPDGAFAYVTNNGDDTVSIVRTSDNTVVGTVPVNPTPMDVAITPDGAFAYVTSYECSTVEVIRTSDNTVVDQVYPVPHAGVRGLDITPDGAFVYVANRLTNDVSVIRTSDNMLVATVSTAPAEPRWVAITPDGDFAYVTLHTTAQVAIIRTVDNVLIDRVPVGDGPVGIDIAEIPEVISVYVDVKPGSWPNPLQVKNRRSRGVLPVAICGREDFDVTTIDPETIRLTLDGVGVAPLRWSYEDVATPYLGDLCSGHDYGGDGILDLTLKFRAQDVIETLGLRGFSDRDVVILILTGNLKAEHGGTPIQGQDCIVILHK